MTHRIREAMKDHGMAGLMSGVVMADETYIGGREKNKHAKDRDPSNSGGKGKVSVLTLIDKRGRTARSKVIPDVTGATLAKAIADQVERTRSLLHTDTWSGDLPVGRSFVARESVNHTEGEYVRGDITTNHVEDFFSQLKRSLDGTHHHVSVEHLSRYLSEFEYRYSTRDLNDTERMGNLLDRVGGRRLTYKRIVTTAA